MSSNIGGNDFLESMGIDSSRVPVNNETKNMDSVSSDWKVLTQKDTIINSVDILENLHDKSVDNPGKRNIKHNIVMCTLYRVEYTTKDGKKQTGLFLNREQFNDDNIKDKLGDKNWNLHFTGDIQAAVNIAAENFKEKIINGDLENINELTVEEDTVSPDNIDLIAKSDKKILTKTRKITEKILTKILPKYAPTKNALRTVKNLSIKALVDEARNCDDLDRLFELNELFEARDEYYSKGGLGSISKAVSAIKNKFRSNDNVKGEFTNSAKLGKNIVSEKIHQHYNENNITNDDDSNFKKRLNNKDIPLTFPEIRFLNLIKKLNVKDSENLNNIINIAWEGNGKPNFQNMYPTVIRFIHEYVIENKSIESISTGLLTKDDLVNFSILIRELLNIELEEEIYSKLVELDKYMSLNYFSNINFEDL
ncbi:MAG: hypothetical protein CMO81_06950 [Waddliaceae bacterium]|nr:hypothetical protein [Waddliaceae bacterium]